MNKFFVMSDIHSFYDEMIKALQNAGYDENDPTHYIVVCGDIFDRGTQPIETLKFFHNKPRCILVRGNHEDLFEDCCHRQKPLMHDISNGTWETINILGSYQHSKTGLNDRTICSNALDMVKPVFDKMVDYFETKKYVFVHGYIPVSDAPSIYVKNEYPIYYHENWRELGDKAWSVARWENGMDVASRGFIEPYKLVVCGHWHTSWAHSRFDDDGAEWGPTANFDPYWGDGVIGIDGCTAYSGKVNCIVLEDEFLDGG